MPEAAPRAGILLVDDDELAREVIHALLQRQLPGARVRIATHGEEAWSMFCAEKPKVVVTDLRMPGMSGEELIAAIRGVDTGMPVIAITGAPDPKGVPGATEVVLKTEYQYLMSRIAAALRDGA